MPVQSFVIDITILKYKCSVDPCRLMLIDAHALMFRFHHAYGKLLQSEAGEETSIAFGFMKTLLAMLEVNPAPSHLVVVMDAPGKTFRSAALSKSFGTTAT